MYYEAIYKCRLCGKVFSTGIVNSKKDFEDIITFKFPETEYFMHHCEDNNIGCADFLGYSKIPKDVCNKLNKEE